MDLKEKILNHILKLNHVTFVELENKFPELKGEPDEDGNTLFMRLGSYENLVLWGGWTDAGFKIIDELRLEKKIESLPAQFLTYMIDGGGLNLPVAKRVKDYKKLHWIPAVLCVPGSKA